MSKQERYDQFRRDFEDSDWEVEEYRGRNFYEGPAIQIEQNELQEAIRTTEVRLQWDALGKNGLIVYPA